jgi:hypothetical protein
VTGVQTCALRSLLQHTDPRMTERHDIRAHSVKFAGGFMRIVVCD